MIDFAALRDQRAAYARDGVLLLKNALSPAEIALARECYDWSLANPGPSRFNVMGGTPGRFFTDTNNPKAFEAYRPFLRSTALVDVAATLWGVDDVWFFYEQIFVKEGGETVRTPWHQDTSYAPIDGKHLMAFWICFEPFPADQSLEFILGTHNGVLYDGSALDGNDPTRPLYGNGEMPVLPDVEADRSNWNIVSYAVEPGDVVVFHPSVLHGGAPTASGQSRHTLTFKLFGPDAVVAKRPGAGEGVKDMPKSELSPMAEIVATIPPGGPFRHPGFPQLRPA
jgi:ectoine hydroxylase-related dioxygenase (phytanoyl-CoA dioxygenase family)